MNWLDGLIIVVLIGFAVAAFRAGLIREIVTLTAVLAGSVIAGSLSADPAGACPFFLRVSHRAWAWRRVGGGTWGGALPFSL